METAKTMTVATSFAMMITVSIYNLSWQNIRDKLRDGLPSSLDHILEDPLEFIQEIMDNTIYDLIEKIELGKLLPRLSKLLLSYYLTWIFGLYTLDLLLYQFSENRYSLFSFLLENTNITISLIPIVLMLAQLIHPWQTAKEKTPPAENKSAGLHYLEALMSNYTTYKGLSKKRRVSFWEKLLYNLAETLSAIPPTVSFKNAILIDAFHLPFTRETKSRIEEIINDGTKADYKLKPLTKRCEKLPTTKTTNTLNKACWHKVYRKTPKNREHIERQVGYTMILAITREHAIDIDKETIKDCIKKIGRKNNLCLNVLQELKSFYLANQGYIIIYMLGNEELLGLKILLS